MEPKVLSWKLLEFGHHVDTEDELLMPKSGYIAAAVVLFFIGFIGFSLNLIVIILICRNKQLWTPLNVILFNLVFGDFLVAAFGNPWTLLSSINYGWMFGKVMCKIYGFFMAWLGITSISTLTVLAFERYMMITRPLRKKALNTETAIFIIAMVWIYSFVLTAPPLLGWGEYVNEAANISCSVNWEERSLNAMTYIVFLFVFGLVVPVAIITFSYSMVIITVRKRTRKSRSENRVTLMVLLMIAAFLLAWTPYAILALMIQFGDASYIQPPTAVIPALIAKSSICYNPIIYIGLNTQFRQILYGLLGKKSNTAKETTGEARQNSSIAPVSKFRVETTRISSVENMGFSPKFGCFSSRSTSNSNFKLAFSKANTIDDHCLQKGTTLRKSTATSL